MALIVLASLCAAAMATAQELTFEFQVTIGGISSDWYMFGLRNDAQQGVDAWDLPQPPAPPGATFWSYLSMLEPEAGLPNRWLHDFRPVSGAMLDRVELWQLTIESAAIGGICRVDIRSTGPIGIRHELYCFGSNLDQTRVQLPTYVSFPVTATSLTMYFELRLDESVATTRSTLGGVKSLFR